MKQKIVLGGIYHICNKSIANYAIFQSSWNAQRFIETLDFYNKHPVWTSFSFALRQKNGYTHEHLLSNRKNPLIKILSYCIMPDHYHLLFKVVSEKSIPKYINDVENSFTRYFNLKHNRKGPLWQSGYRSVRIKSDEQLLHVSRYIHLNPSTNNLVTDPIYWRYSSYRDLVTNQSLLNQLVEFSITNKNTYKKFVENNKEYQKSLKKIKSRLLE